MSLQDFAEEQEIRKFEEESGVAYEDFSDDFQTPNEIKDTSADGKSVEEISTLKDIGYSVGSGLVDCLQSIGSLGYKVAESVTTKAKTGEWQWEGDEGTGNPFAENFDPSAVKSTLGETVGGAIENIGGAVEKGASYDPKTIAGSFAKPIAQYAGSYGVAKKALGAVTGLKSAKEGVTGLARFAKTEKGIEIANKLNPVINSFGADMLAFWQDDKNITSVLQDNVDNPYIKNVLGYLAVEEDDSDAEKALKQATEGLFFGAAADALMKSFKYIKLGRKSAKKVKELSEPITSKIDAEASVTKKTAKKQAKKAVKSAKEVALESPEAKIVEQEIADEDFGMRVAKFREAKPDEYARIKQKSLDRIVETSGVDIDTMNEEQFGQLMKNAEKDIDKVVLAVQREEDVFTQGLDRINQIKDNFVDGTLNREERDKVFDNVLDSIADAYAKVQDAANAPAQALGYTSKEGMHSDIKKAINGLLNNADKVEKDQIYQAFSMASTPEELLQKLQKLGEVAKDYKKKGTLRKLLDKTIALDQAGLMSNMGTIMRNAYSGLDMAFSIGVEAPVAHAIGKTRGFIKKTLGKGETYDVATINDAVELSKSFASAMEEVINWGLKKVTMQENAVNPFGKYRERLGGGKTYLPKSVSQTFNPDGFFGRLANGWMRFSGVGISETIDDFVGNVFYRTRAASLADNYVNKVAKSRKLSNEAKEQLRKNIINKTLDVDFKDDVSIAQMFDSNIQDVLAARAISNKAKDYALYRTYRKGGSGAERMVRTAFDIVPPLRLAQPFLITGTRIFFEHLMVDRTLLGLLSPRKWDVIKKGGRELDEFMGQQIVGNSLLLTAYMMNDAGMITGDGPISKQGRDAWRSAGIKPNSIVIKTEDGGRKYISLDGLGVVSELFKLGASMRELMADQDDEQLKDQDFLDTIGLYSLYIADHAFNSTTYRFFGDLLSAIKGNNDKMIEKLKLDFLASPLINMVPRGMFKDSKMLKQTADDNLEKIKNRMGIPTRNYLDMMGEEIPADQRGEWVFAGVNTRNLRMDRPVLLEMARISAFVKEPSTTESIGGVYVKLENDEVYRIKQNMKKLGVEKKLEKIIASSDYKNASKEQKKKGIQNLYRAAKREAIEMEVMNNEGLQNRIEELRLKKDTNLRARDDLSSDVPSIEGVPTLTK